MVKKKKDTFGNIKQTGKEIAMEEKKKDGFGIMERRTFVKGAAIAGAAAMVSPLMLSRVAFGKEKSRKQLDMEKAAMEIETAYTNDPVAMRALNRAKAIAGKKKGIQLTVFMPAGAVINFMPFTKIWEKETGTEIF